MHNKTIEEVLSITGSTTKGLTEEEAKKRQKLYGLNKIEIEEESIYKIFLRQFSSPLVIILLIAAFIAFIFQEYKDVIFILAIVLINGLIGFYQEFKAKLKISELLKLTVPKATVLREGKEVKISAEEITIGDIVLLKEGDVVPADIRLISSTQLLVDESILTGESVPVEKLADVILPEETPLYERQNLVFAGTYIHKGMGMGVVFAIGIDTEMGRIYKKLEVKERVTPLTRAIAKFSKRWVVVLLVLLSLIFALSLFQGRDLKSVILLVLAQLVSSVPEGLPIVMTIALVIGAIVLYRKKTLIRQLPAVEALGSATFICTDKTGTLTENRLIVSEVYSLEPHMDHIIFSLANDSDLDRGDPIEIALIKWIKEKGADHIYIRESYPRIWHYPFDPKLRLMGSAHRVEEKNYLFIKGAFESLEKLAFNRESLEILRKVHDEMAEKGLRVLAFGYSEFEEIPKDISKIKIKLIGIVGFLDPIKETAIEAVEAAKRAGINVIMITGDNLKTAKYIASMVGIHDESKICLEGRELNHYTEEELIKLLPKVSVIARATPEDKYKVVKLLQEKGEEVVMLGDGVNDLPAVKSADLGIAMYEGAEATKSVAKMVLLERDLSVIVDAIKIGRRISHNLRKVILYLLSTSVGEVTFLFLAFFLGLPQPLYPTQILWINIVSDGIQDKPLVLTKEEKWIFSLKPSVFTTWFLDAFQLYRILTFALFMSVVCLGIFTYLLSQNYPLDTAITIVFLSSVACQWAHGFQNVREYPFFLKPLENFRLNPYIYIVVIFIGIPLQLFAVYVLKDYLHCTPLKASDWIYPAIAFILAFTMLEIRKWIEKPWLIKYYKVK